MKPYLCHRNIPAAATLLLLECLKTVGIVGVAVILSLQIDAISNAISTGNMALLANHAVVCFLYAAALGLTIFITERKKGAFIKRVMLNVRQDVFHGILNRSIADYYANNSAEYITMLNQSLGTLEENYLKNFFSVFESCVSILAAVILLLYINPAIAVISIIAMAIPSLIPKLYGKTIGTRQDDIIREAALYTAKLKDAFNGFEVLKSYRAEHQAEALHQSGADEFESSKVRMSNTMAQLYGITNMASITVQFLIMLLSGTFAVKGIITIGNIIAVTQLTGQVISPAFELSAKITQLKAAKPICEQIKSVIAKENSKKAEPKLAEMKKTLELKDVSFAYADTPTIKRISFSFERGKKYAIIGKSGSGKSTFLKLLAGYYENYEGEIAVDENSKVQCDCVLIHQNVFLFDDTIRNNITLYEIYSEEEILAAVHAAGLDEVVRNLPDGMDSRVEENGMRFSGGERQRIAIARAILHRKTVYLMDEATSSLDKENAQKVEDYLLTLDNVTCITVTHRLEPGNMRKYDAVLEMKNGSLIQLGGDASPVKASNRRIL